MSLNRKNFNRMIGFATWVCLRSKGMDYHVFIRYKAGGYVIENVKEVGDYHKNPCVFDLYPFRFGDDDIKTVEGMVIDQKLAEMEENI